MVALVTRSSTMSLDNKGRENSVDTDKDYGRLKRAFCRSNCQGMLDMCDNIGPQANEPQMLMMVYASCAQYAADCKSRC